MSSSKAIEQAFVSSFTQANNNISPYVLANSLRVLAVVLTILAVMWTIVHFMAMEERMHADFMTRLGGRLIKLITALSVFIIIIASGGKLS